MVILLYSARRYPLSPLRLRQDRERLGLTYRDAERASYELAARRGRPDFIIHISRLADIENRGLCRVCTNCTRWRPSTG
jgi:hypothetical protein